SPRPARRTSASTPSIRRRRSCRTSSCSHGRCEEEEEGGPEEAGEAARQGEGEGRAPAAREEEAADAGQEADEAGGEEAGETGGQEAGDEEAACQDVRRQAAGPHDARLGARRAGDRRRPRAPRSGTPAAPDATRTDRSARD